MNSPRKAMASALVRIDVKEAMFKRDYITIRATRRNKIEMRRAARLCEMTLTGYIEELHRLAYPRILKASAGTKYRKR